MTAPNGFDRLLAAWLDEQAPMREPDGLMHTVTGTIERTRRPPGWAILERWLPMQTRAKFGAIPRTAIIIVTLGLLLALLSAIALGQQPSLKLPPPLGPARNGLIAFDSNGDIWVSDPDGTERRQLTSGPDIDLGPIFSPDGSSIAFWNKADSDGQASLVVMDSNGGRRRTLADGLTLIRGADAGHREPTWSHDSRRLAYSDRLVSGVASIDRVSVASLEGGVPLEIARTASGATWSPDDSMIAYRGGELGSAAGRPLGVYLVDSVGGEPRALLTPGTEDTNPAAYIYPQWSPDGKRITYSAGAPAVFVTTVEYPNPQAITDRPGSEVLPVWSPDGSHIAFDRAIDDTSFHVVVADPDGSTQTDLVHPPVIDRFPTWSPDGKWLIGYLPDGSGMLVLDAFGTTEPMVLSAPGEVGYSSWQRLAP